MSETEFEQTTEIVSEQSAESEQEPEQESEDVADPGIVEKTYTYVRNGKTVTVHRKWKRGTRKAPKLDAIKSYFDNHMDTIKETKRIKKVYDDFCAEYPDVNCSYSTLYGYYQKVFSTRKPRKPKAVQQDATATDEQK